MLSHPLSKLAPVVLVASATAGCGGDEVAFGEANTQAVNTQAVWAAPFSEHVWEVTVEPSHGDVVLTGSSEWVTRLDADGTPLFSQLISNSSSLDALPLGAEGTLVFGTCFEPATVGGATICADVDVNVGGSELFLIELDRAGAAVRSTGFNTSSSGAFVRPEAVAVGSDGTVHIGGTFSGSVDFGDGEMATDATSIFYLQLDSSWETRLSRDFGATSARVHHVAVDDATGDVALVGTYSGVATFAGINLTNGPNGDAIFVTRLSSDAKARWANNHLGGGDFGARFDADGGLLIFGRGFAPYTSFGGADVIDGPFATKLDAAGGHAWTWREHDSQRSATATIDAAGRVVAIYTHRVVLEEGAEPAPDCWDENGFFDQSRVDCQYRAPRYRSDRLFTVVSPDGRVLSSTTLASSEDDYTYFGEVALAPGADGSVVAAVVGADGGVDFGSGPLSGDTVLAKMLIVDK